MPVNLVGAKNTIMFFAGDRLSDQYDQVVISRPRPPLTAGWRELKRSYANRDTRRAITAYGDIGQTVTAAEPGLREHVMQGVRMTSRQFRDQTPLRSVRQIGTR